MDPVSAYMVKTIRDIDAESSVKDAAEKLDSFGVGLLLVKKDSDYVGVVSEQEITRQLVAKNLGSNNTSVSDIMNPDIDYIDQEETMSKAIAIMREKRLRYLVVRDGKTVAGILSVKDLLAYLQLIINKKDTIALRRVVNFPPRGIGLKTVDKCVQEAKKSNLELFDVLADPSKMNIRGKQADELNHFFEIISKYHDLLDKLNAGELVRTLVDETGILKHYKRQDTAEDLERINNINEVLNSVDEFMARNPQAMLTDFLEEVSLLTGIDQWNDQENRVTLMTVHSAKGLEFPVVFLTGLEDGLFPFYSTLQDKNEFLIRCVESHLCESSESNFHSCIL